MTDRAAAFKADIAELRISDPATTRDRLALRVGLAAMAAGVILPVTAYFLSHDTTNALQQRDALVVALLGVAMAVAGSALYLKAALAGFLRFWLVRQLHEQRTQTDRILHRMHERPEGSGVQASNPSGVLGDRGAQT